MRVHHDQIIINLCMFIAGHWDYRHRTSHTTTVNWWLVPGKWTCRTSMTLWKLKSCDGKSGNVDRIHSIFMFCYWWIFLYFRLTLTNIEEQVIASNLVHETNCVISMPEFALRLQISVDDPITAQLFHIFDTVIYSCPHVYQAPKFHSKRHSNSDAKGLTQHNTITFCLFFFFFFRFWKIYRKCAEQLTFANIYCVLCIWSNKAYQPWI